MGPFYEAIGKRIFDAAPGENPGPGTRAFVEPVLDALGLPVELAEALDDASFDDELRQKTDEALSLTGNDVGTPIIQLGPPSGGAFFGPVIIRLPNAEEAGVLWDHVVALATFPGFAELKRSLRERPQLRSFGVSTEEVGLTEDWHGGSRRQKVRPAGASTRLTS